MSWSLRFSLLLFWWLQYEFRTRNETKMQEKIYPLNIKEAYFPCCVHCPFLPDSTASVTEWIE